MTKSENINDLATALAIAQGQMSAASKDSSNPYFNSSYADLASVWDTIREPLSKNGLSVVQLLEPIENGQNLVTMLMHKSGQFLSSTVPVKPVKNDPQGLGSAITYMRRYALMAITGVAPDDDDGNAASSGGQSQAKPASQPKTEKPKPVATPKEYRFPGGPFKGKTLKEVPFNELLEFGAYCIDCMDAEKAEGKEPSKHYVDAVREIDAFKNKVKGDHGTNTAGY